MTRVLQKCSSNHSFCVCVSKTNRGDNQALIVIVIFLFQQALQCIFLLYTIV